MAARQQIVLRVEGAVKRGAVAAAKKAGLSLNEYCAKRIAGARTSSGATSKKS